jgi:protein CpxP
MTDPNTTNTRRVWWQSAVALVLIGGGFALGAASVATAHGDMDGGGMMGGWHHHRHGPRVGTIQHMVRGALDNVGATAAQEDKVHDIIAKASTDLDQGNNGSGDDKGAMKKQVLELMKAPTLDRAAFDKLRADKVAAMDAKSKTIEDALFQAASQLSPEQRTKLVASVQERMEHHGWGGWHHHGGMDGHDGEHGMHDHGGMGGPHDGGGAPDHG